MGGNTDLVRRLGSSRFNYWFGYVANGAWVAWLVRHGLPGGTSPLGWQAFAAYACAGLVLWTFLEYLLHRFVYHVIPSFLSVGHALHHDRPRELIGVPWWLTSVCLGLIFAGLRRVFDPGATGVVLGSCWAGYIGYCLLHHGSHHWRMQSRYLRRVKKLHQLHHVYPNTNWGFTTHLWDVVFGTYVAPGAAKAARNAKATSGQAEAPPGLQPHA